MNKISTKKETQELAITIYNGGFGAVKEKRRIDLEQGDTHLLYGDVAQLIETDSLIVEGINVVEFNYDFDLVNKEKLLMKYIDKEVFIRSRETGERKSCRLLSVDVTGRCVLEDNNSKEIYLDSQDEIILPTLPSGLIVSPALVWKILGNSESEVSVSYLSKGFNWKANYVVELKETFLNVIGWAEINNQSGMTYENAKVKLIAGDVNRVNEEMGLMEVRHFKMDSTLGGQAQEKTFFDYHMYTLNNLTTIKDNQTKQVNILSGENIPYNQYYKLDLYDDSAEIMVEFENEVESGLGIPMPKGRIKLYKEDVADNSLEFIGEDEIDHTPKGETITLSIGKAFDVTFEYDEIDRKKIKGFEHFKYRCKVSNHKMEAIKVHFEPNIWGSWEMVSSTHEFNKKSSRKLEYIIDIEADGEEVIEFEYKIDMRTELIIK